MLGSMDFFAALRSGGAQKVKPYLRKLRQAGSSKEAQRGKRLGCRDLLAQAGIR